MTRILICVLAATLFGVAAISPAPAGDPWSERLDLLVEASGQPGRTAAPSLMVCVLDAAGGARCHHRDGVLTGAAGGGRGPCAQADRRLQSLCGPAGTCRFRDVAVPAGAFGLFVVALEPPVFGVPRHVERGRLIVTDAGGADGTAERIGQHLGALSRCLAPARDVSQIRIQTVSRSACRTEACAFGSTAVRLQTRPNHADAGH